MRVFVKSFIFATLVCSFTSAQDEDCLRNNIEFENILKSELSESYKSGDKVRVNCLTGYVGFLRLSCQNGLWTKEAGRECKRKPCGHPGDTANGEFQLTEGTEFVFGATVKYTCNVGYILVSRFNTRNCRSQGWDNAIPACEVVHCPSIPTSTELIASGNTEEPSFEDVIHFECTSRNLMLDGPEHIRCTEHGSWSAPVPKCTEIKCKPPKIDNGDVSNRKEEYKENQELEYTCKLGYKARHGKPKCLRNGWSMSPECEEIICLLPLKTTGTDITKPIGKNIFRAEESVDITCSKGYRLIGTKQTSGSIRCRDNGEWESRPVCEEMICDIPYDQHVYHPYYYFNEDRKLGTHINYRCDHGYVKSDVYATCREDGWTPKPLCREPLCEAPEIAFAETVTKPQQTYKPGARIQIRCHPGYEPEQFTITCKQDRTWDNKRSCTVKPDICSTFKLENGFMHYPDKPSKSIYFSCDRNYKTFEGTSWGETSCSLGEFSSTPQCIRDDECGRFPSIAHGAVVGEIRIYQQNGWAEFKCDFGYKSDQNYIRCDKGQWITQECKQDDRCGPFPRVENAVITSQRENLVMLQCRENFELKGLRVKSKYVYCRDREWDKPPTCELLQSSCLQPEKEILNGIVKDLHNLMDYYAEGSTVEYECSEGFKFRFGAPTSARCAWNQWTYPTCIVSVEVKKPDIPEIRVTPTPRQPDPEKHHTSGVSTICGPPPKIEDAVQDFKESYKDGEKAAYDCPALYIEDKAEVTCIRGRWEGEGKCWKPCTVTEDTMEQRKLDLLYRETQKMYARHGDFIHFRCQSGYQHRGPTALRQQCNDGKMLLPVCEKRK